MEMLICKKNRGENIHKMKLFLISQDVNNGWDSYDSAVVCAENEEEAKKIHPDGEYNYEEGIINPSYCDFGRWKKADKYYGTWAKKEFVKVEEIGEANNKQEKGVICSSFNAG